VGCSISFRTDGSFLAVVDVSLGEPDVKDDDESAYAGPVSFGADLKTSAFSTLNMVEFIGGCQPGHAGLEGQ